VDTRACENRANPPRLRARARAAAALGVRFATLAGAIDTFGPPGDPGDAVREFNQTDVETTSISTCPALAAPR